MAVNDEQKVHVFVSYSHHDKRWIERLQVHLKPLSQDYDIEIWDDTRIKPGSKWREEIRDSVDRANVAVLIISADFLASDFIRTNELPPLLKAAEDEGALILPIIVSPSLFMRNPDISQFQAVNDPAKPLVSASRGEQEEAFVSVAEVIIEKADTTRRLKSEEKPGYEIILDGPGESFLEKEIWTRLIKIGDWIYDSESSRIIGSGKHAYLVSRQEYGETHFKIEAQLEFKDFKGPSEGKLGMNAGIVFGFKHVKEVPRYYNVLITGSELLVERVGFEGGADAQHVTDPVPFEVESGKSYEISVVGDPKTITVIVEGKEALTLDRPTGVVGRVGLRPWRSRMDCTKFAVNDIQEIGMS